jgi:ankyrin repeat protein
LISRFVLAVPFLESLVGKRSSGDVEEALKALVESSDKISTVYDGAIERIDSQNRNDRETAHRVLSWIVHAKRLLTCQELQHALAVRTGSREFQEQYVYHHLEEIVALCAGLVVINRESNTVQLMHDTTRMYFGDRTHQPDWIRTAEVERALNCLTYPSLNCFESGYATNKKMFEERLARYTFLNYAACFWGEHARAVQEMVDLRKVAGEFLQNAELISCAAQAKYAVHQIPIYGFSLGFPKQVALHFMAQFGLHQFLSDLLVKSQENERSDLNVHDSLLRTPLSYAAEKGHEAVVKLLLEKGAELESRALGVRTPLSWAAEKGREAVVKLLLEKGAELESRDTRGRTPLSWAAENGREAAVKLLLEKGAELESRDTRGRTPLSWAAEKGREAVVKLLQSRT